MAADNPNLIISVSAFGFGDSVTINGHAYPEEALTPSVIIEDPSHKLYLYGARARHERTGAGLTIAADEDTGLSLKDDAACCTLVAVLWQQLKASSDMLIKQAAADRICKHVIQIICDLKPKIAADDELKALVPLLTRSNLRAKAQLVLLIPDNFTEVEQQCLLNAFLGFNVKLLWRSVAALMGAKASLDNALLPLLPNRRIYSASSHREQRLLVHVLYLGADSIDLSSYELKRDPNSDYLIPVRLQAVYQDCPLGLSYLHFALSAAHYYARQITDNTFAVTHSTEGAQVERSLCQQLLSHNVNIWGIDQDLQQMVLKVTVKGQTKWVQLPEFKSNVRITQELNLTDLARFYQRYEIAPLSESAAPQAGNFITQLAAAIKNKLAATRTNQASFCFIVGPTQLVQDNAIFSYLKPLLSRDSAALQLRFEELPAAALSQGGMSFQDRLNRGLATYLDRLPKFSTFVTNETQDAYQERVLIEEKEIEPQEEVSSSLALQISKGANWIDLFVSADPKFNQAAIEQASEVSFKEQGISVKKAQLAFTAGAKALTDEPVTVSVMQRPLSGYVKIKIAPQGASHVLPPYGVTCAFDPVKTPDFAECIPRLARAYPPLPEPNKEQWVPPFITLRNLTKSNTIFSSSYKSSNLVCYNGKFSPGYEDRIRRQLNYDLSIYYPKLRELYRQGADWKRLHHATRPAVLNAFSDRIDQCLPVTWVGPADWPDTSEVAPMIERMLYNALTTDVRRSHKLMRQYCIFTLDQPDAVQACCAFFLHLKQARVPLNYYHMAALKTLIENHPRCFNPRSDEFCMTYEFARLLTAGSQAILRASFEEVTAANMIKNKTVTGTKKLSISLVILMYSLMYRCQDRDYLALPQELAQVEQLLLQVQAHYSAVAKEINRICLDRYFNDRVNAFVENKLKTLIPQVIEYLKKKGTNSNIMAAINDLDVEGDKD